jgi:hypothetical protein
MLEPRLAGSSILLASGIKNATCGGVSGGVWRSIFWSFRRAFFGLAHYRGSHSASQHGKGSTKVVYLPGFSRDFRASRQFAAMGHTAHRALSRRVIKEP